MLWECTYPGDLNPPRGDSAGRITHSNDRSHTGDAVIGLAAERLGSHVVCPGMTLASIPSTMPFAEAAICPTVYITVDMALLKCSEMQHGESYWSTERHEPSGWQLCRLFRLKGKGNRHCRISLEEAHAAYHGNGHSAQFTIRRFL